jgi:hypothetical protein
LLSLIGLREQGPKAVDNLASAMASTHDPIKSGLCFAVFGRDHFKKSLCCVAACYDSCKRLSYFMSNRSHSRPHIHQLIVSFAL